MGNPIPRKKTVLIYKQEPDSESTGPVGWQPRYQRLTGQHGAHMGPVGPRRTPCWPQEPCYQGSSALPTYSVGFSAAASTWWDLTHCQLLNITILICFPDVCYQNGAIYHVFWLTKCLVRFIGDSTYCFKQTIYWNTFNKSKCKTKWSFKYIVKSIPFKMFLHHADRGYPVIVLSNSERQFT